MASGSRIAVVVETGLATLLGGMAASLEMPEPETAFDTGIQRFTWLMIPLAPVMTPLVILINGVTKGDGWAALLFGLAVAVGLTREMLPMVVTVCLARGALAMSRRKVIVKHIDSIQNLGAMDVLCADCILLDTDRRVLWEGVCEGWRVFVNIVKYLRLGASSNFGNMLSMLRLPFVESRASLALTATTAAVALAGVWLPGSALRHVFGSRGSRRAEPCRPAVARVHGVACCTGFHSESSPSR